MIDASGDGDEGSREGGEIVVRDTVLGMYLDGGMFGWFAAGMWWVGEGFVALRFHTDIVLRK